MIFTLIVLKLVSYADSANEQCSCNRP